MKIEIPEGKENILGTEFKLDKEGIWWVDPDLWGWAIEHSGENKVLLYPPFSLDPLDKLTWEDAFLKAQGSDWPVWGDNHTTREFLRAIEFKAPEILQFSDPNAPWYAVIEDRYIAFDVVDKHGDLLHVTVYANGDVTFDGGDITLFEFAWDELKQAIDEAQRFLKLGISLDKLGLNLSAFQKTNLLLV